ncbi:MAG: NUDIX domain-containing protein [Patescibacteria group bacterium]|jgi:ADP-ribose pyrophosphatase YjhB (NUDIX family)
MERFYSGGFLYNPKAQSVLSHLRDDKTPNNPNKWVFFGGLNEVNESPKECLIRKMKEESGVSLKEEEPKSLDDCQANFFARILRVSCAI